MTAPKSNAAATREAHDMAIGAKRDVSNLTTRVTSLADKQATHERILTDPNAKGGLVKTQKGMERAHQRITNLSKTFGDRLDLVEESLFALRAGGFKLFIDTVRASGASDDDIKKALAILRDGDGPLDLSDDEFVAELFTAFMSFKSAVQDELNRQNNRLDEHDSEFGKLGARVTHLETAFKEVKSRVTESISKLPLVIGLIAGVVTFIVANAQDDVSGWRALGFAVAISAISAGILSFFAAQIANMISETRKLSKSTTSEQNAEADTNNTRSSASDDRTQVVSPDQTEHQPDLASAGS